MKNPFKKEEFLRSWFETFKERKDSSKSPKTAIYLLKISILLELLFLLYVAYYWGNVSDFISTLYGLFVVQGIGFCLILSLSCVILHRKYHRDYILSTLEKC